MSPKPSEFDLRQPPTSATGDSGAVPNPAPVSLSVQEGQGET